MTDRATPFAALAPPADEGEWLALRDLINRLITQSNAHSSFTLSAGSTTTTVVDFLVGPDSRIVWSPTTANAAAEIGAGGMYASTVSAGSFVITHASNSQSDRTFNYLLVG